MVKALTGDLACSVLGAINMKEEGNITAEEKRCLFEQYQQLLSDDFTVELEVVKEEGLDESFSSFSGMILRVECEAERAEQAKRVNFKERCSSQNSNGESSGVSR